MSRAIRVLAWTACAALLAGCAGDDAGAPAETPSGAAVPVSIAPQPTLTLGVASGDTLQEFGRLVTPLLFPDGRVAVPLGIAQEIRIFGPDGSFIQTLGGEGEGPGEFSGLAGVWLRGDTLEAYDWRLLRVTRFFPDGGFGSVRLVDPPGPNLTPIPRGTQPDGSWLLQTFGPIEWGRRDRLLVERYRLDGTYAGRVAEVEGMLRRQAPGMTGPGPLSPIGKLALHDGEVYLAETLTPMVQAFDTTGTRVRSIAWEPDRTFGPREALGIIEDSLLARASRGEDAGFPEVAEGLSERLDYFRERDDFVSVFAGFLVDELGFVWVQPFDPAKHSTTYMTGAGAYGGWSAGGEWRVFSPEGMEVGSVVVPSELAPVQITDDAVLGIRTDELGVERVQLHRLERR